MLNREIKKVIEHSRNRAVALTILVTFPLGILAGMGLRAHTQRDRAEDAYIRLKGAQANLLNTQAEKMIQDARDKIARGE